MKFNREVRVRGFEPLPISGLLAIRPFGSKKFIDESVHRNTYSIFQKISTS